MQRRIAQFLLAELLALGAFVFAGLAALGGVMTWSGQSRHPSGISWALVVLFAGAAILFGRTALRRFRRVLRPR